jgi:hypothetical protein
VRGESPARSNGASSRLSGTDELVGRRACRHRETVDSRAERRVRSNGERSLASCTDEWVERYAYRPRAQNATRGERGEIRGSHRREQHGSSGARSAEAGRSRNRLAHPRGVGRGHRVLWRNSDVLLAQPLVRARPFGWWIAPDEEPPFGRAPGVQRSRRGVGRPLRDVPEGFGEKEESMRPRASLHGAQKMARADNVCRFVAPMCGGIDTEASSFDGVTSLDSREAHRTLSGGVSRRCQRLSARVVVQGVSSE